MTKHSPGPWVVGKSHAGTVVLEQRGSYSAELARPVGLDREPEVLEANARLIAAAPELLEALRELVERCDGDEGVRADGSNIQTMRAHAVIAALKAK